MRRLFIMRKDLNMSTGKLLAQTMHCAEAYWTRKLRESACIIPSYNHEVFNINITVPIREFDEYVCGQFTKTVCEARNKNHLLKAKNMADAMGLIEGEHYGLIYDKCLTELEPEEEDGTILTGIWFCPLSDEQAHTISKKYQLYK